MGGRTVSGVIQTRERPPLDPQGRVRVPPQGPGIAPGAKTIKNKDLNTWGIKLDGDNLDERVVHSRVHQAVKQLVTFTSITARRLHSQGFGVESGVQGVQGPAGGPGRSDAHPVGPSPREPAGPGHPVQLQAPDPGPQDESKPRRCCPGRGRMDAHLRVFCFVPLSRSCSEKPWWARGWRWRSPSPTRCPGC